MMMMMWHMELFWMLPPLLTCLANAVSGITKCACCSHLVISLVASHLPARRALYSDLTSPYTYTEKNRKRKTTVQDADGGIK